MSSVKITDLHKSYGDNTNKAVDGINLDVPSGCIFGFLGPNGAGKTTTMRILATLLTPDKGQVSIAGFDLAKEQQKIRSVIGYVGQKNSCHAATNAYENILLQARLHGMSKSAAIAATNKMIDLFELSSFSQRKTEHLSGGQRRRIDIAIGMVHSPKILFLDEPTTGLDIQSRTFLWNEINKLRDQGTTVFLTTHYLEEADQVCDRIAIIDHGQIVAEGTTEELKYQIAGDILTIAVDSQTDFPDSLAEQFRQKSFVNEISVNKCTAKLYLKPNINALPDVIETVNLSKIQVSTINLSQPSLDQVFLEKTGRSLRDSN